MAITTNFKNSSGSDLGSFLVEKSYLIDRYPELADTFKQAGLWVWGRNDSNGQLGDNTNVNKSSPIQTVAGGTNWKQVASGAANYIAAIKTDGTLWLWGQNNSGQLGDNTIVAKSSPIQTVAGGTNWKQISAGNVHAAAIKTDGTLWTWGYNFDGALGDDTQISRSSPIQTVAGGTNWKQVSTGGGFNACIKTDGTLWTWGYNFSGTLGDNTTDSKSSPIQTVSGGTNWKQVSAGGGFNACVKTDGTLWLWGTGTLGVLGNNNTTNQSSPVQTVSGGTNWKQVSAGQYHTAAIKTDGTLWLWGDNQYGTLGNNGFLARSSPVQTISAGTNWKQVAGVVSYTAAIKTDGTLWLWGRNNYGNLGDSTITDISSPIQTVAGGTNWKQVAGGTEFTACIRDDSADVFGDPT